MKIILPIVMFLAIISSLLSLIEFLLSKRHKEILISKIDSLTLRVDSLDILAWLLNSSFLSINFWNFLFLITGLFAFIKLDFLISKIGFQDICGRTFWQIPVLSKVTVIFILLVGIPYTIYLIIQMPQRTDSNFKNRISEIAFSAYLIYTLIIILYSIFGFIHIYPIQDLKYMFYGKYIGTALFGLNLATLLVMAISIIIALMLFLSVRITQIVFLLLSFVLWRIVTYPEGYVKAIVLIATTLVTVTFTILTYTFGLY